MGLSYKKKTNIDHLRAIIKDNDEACEFLDAIENELTDAIKSADDAEDEVKSLELKNAEFQYEINNLNEEGLGSVIRTPVGDINYEANNLQHIAIFEALEEKLKYKSPLEIEAAINAL